MSADQLPTPLSPVYAVIERFRHLSAVASSAPDSFRRGVGADHGTAERVPSAVASSAVPPSNESTRSEDKSDRAEGAAVTARNEGTR